MSLVGIPTSGPLGGWPVVLGRLIAGGQLSSYEASVVMKEVLLGNATTAQLGAFLALLRARHETVDELAGLAQAMLDAATAIDGLSESTRERLVDTCGTGGDRSGTINVSTMAALVVAAVGVPICKHGNRAATSLTGSADVLEELGVKVDLGPAGVVTCIEEAGIGFCLASLYHPGAKYAGPVRRELGVPTVFNVLGPLTNPARVRRQVIGVSDPSFAGLMLDVLRIQGASRAMVVYGHDGLDEITTTTLSTIHELCDGDIRRYDINPTVYGMPFSDPASLKGGGPADNARRLRLVLEGQRGPQADIVILNAAAALVVAGVVDELADGVALARDVLSDGRAAAVLERLVAASQTAAAAESGM